MILKTDGSVWTAGSATALSGTPTHRLGAGTPVSSTEWQQIADGGRYVAAGVNQSLIIKTDDSLWMFGDNSFGQCGLDPAQSEGLPTPTRIMGGVSQASTFGRYTAAITTDGRLLVWGSSILPGDRWEPTPAGSATDSLSVSNFHMVGRGQDGAWWGAGENGSGQLLSLPTGSPGSSLGSVGGP
jgi:alpha-tubulin suppressor-like RCC1 family protein